MESTEKQHQSLHVMRLSDTRPALDAHQVRDYQLRYLSDVTRKRTWSSPNHNAFHLEVKFNTKYASHQWRLTHMESGQNSQSEMFRPMDISEAGKAHYAQPMPFSVFLVNQGWTIAPTRYEYTRSRLPPGEVPGKVYLDLRQNFARADCHHALRCFMHPPASRDPIHKDKFTRIIAGANKTEFVVLRSCLFLSVTFAKCDDKTFPETVQFVDSTPDEVLATILIHHAFNYHITMGNVLQIYNAATRLQFTNVRQSCLDYLLLQKTVKWERLCDAFCILDKVGTPLEMKLFLEDLEPNAMMKLRGEVRDRIGEMSKQVLEECILNWQPPSLPIATSATKRSTSATTTSEEDKHDASGSGDDDDDDDKTMPCVDEETMEEELTLFVKCLFDENMEANVAQMETLTEIEKSFLSAIVASLGCVIIGENYIDTNNIPYLATLQHMAREADSQCSSLMALLKPVKAKIRLEYHIRSMMLVNRLALVVCFLSQTIALTPSHRLFRIIKTSSNPTSIAETLDALIEDKDTLRKNKADIEWVKRQLARLVRSVLPDRSPPREAVEDPERSRAAFSAIVHFYNTIIIPPWLEFLRDADALLPGRVPEQLPSPKKGGLPHQMSSHDLHMTLAELVSGALRSPSSSSVTSTTEEPAHTGTSYLPLCNPVEINLSDRQSPALWCGQPTTSGAGLHELSGLVRPVPIRPLPALEEQKKKRGRPKKGINDVVDQLQKDQQKRQHEANVVNIMVNCVVDTMNDPIRAATLQAFNCLSKEEQAKYNTYQEMRTQFNKMMSEMLAIQTAPPPASQAQKCAQSHHRRKFSAPQPSPLALEERRSSLPGSCSTSEPLFRVPRLPVHVQSTRPRSNSKSKIQSITSVDPAPDDVVSIVACDQQAPPSVSSPNISISADVMTSPPPSIVSSEQPPTDANTAPPTMPSSCTDISHASAPTSGSVTIPPPEPIDTVQETIDAVTNDISKWPRGTSPVVIETVSSVVLKQSLPSRNIVEDETPLKRSRIEDTASHTTGASPTPTVDHLQSSSSYPNDNNNHVNVDSPIEQHSPDPNPISSRASPMQISPTERANGAVSSPSLLTPERSPLHFVTTLPDYSATLISRFPSLSSPPPKSHIEHNNGFGVFNSAVISQFWQANNYGRH